MLFVREMPGDPREKMYYAALHLFTSKGFKETSILEIVEKARVSKTTFYQQFNGKEELLVNLCQQIAEEMIEEIEKAIQPEERITHKAYAGIHRYIEICTTQRKIARLLLVSSVGISQKLERFRRDAYQRMARLIFQKVHAYVPKEVSEDELRIVSQAMIGAINEVVVQSLMESDKDVDPEQLAQTLNQIVVGSFVNLSLKDGQRKSSRDRGSSESDKENQSQRNLQDMEGNRKGNE